MMLVAAGFAERLDVSRLRWAGKDLAVADLTIACSWLGATTTSYIKRSINARFIDNRP
jgi:hypothetical protein